MVAKRKGNQGKDSTPSSKAQEEEQFNLGAVDAEEEVEDADDVEEEFIEASDEEDGDKGTGFLYDSSSDEEWEDPNKNTVGKIPMQFYDDFDHVGYNIQGKKIMKPTKKDEIDKFLDKEDDPNYWRTVHNTLTGQDVVISEQDYKLITSLIKSRFPGDFDEYEAFPEFEWEDGIHPVSNAMSPKQAFIPSRDEAKKIRKLARAIKNGWLKIKSKAELREERAEKRKTRFYDLWGQESEEMKQRTDHIPAPKLKLPIHSESYNPPEEYLFTEEERKEWEETEQYKRLINYIPQKYTSLRSIPLYQDITKERFERCLDLFMCPRQLSKPKKILTPEDLIPKIPSPEELKPFPTRQTMVYTGHTEKIRTITVDPTGQYFASGSDDKTVRIWEVQTGRCVNQFTFDTIIYRIVWNPDPSKPIIAVAASDVLYIVGTGTGNQEENDFVNELLSKPPGSDESTVKWEVVKEKNGDIKLKIPHDRIIRHITWHFKGDYLTATCPDAIPKNQLLVHQVSLKRTQNPFSKQKAKIQCAIFHPSKPYLFIATQQHVKMYDLAKLSLEKKMTPTSAQWISSIDIHPGGDNLIIGSYDKKVFWFDLDTSAKPYKTMKYHKLAVRTVVYHKRYPLFASCSDDLNLHVFHGMVYSDLLKDPLIVPLRILKGHKEVDELGILDCAFHPYQPWLFSAGADATVRLYT